MKSNQQEKKNTIKLVLIYIDMSTKEKQYAIFTKVIMTNYIKETDSDPLKYKKNQKEQEGGPLEKLKQKK